MDKLKTTDLLHWVHGQTLQLMPERCVFWQEKKMILAADLHLGKEGTFRSAGIPLPEGPSIETLNRLDRALRRTGATRLVILGDLFHGSNAVAACADMMTDWREHHSALVIELIGASHDRWSGALPEHWKIEVHDEPRFIQPFALYHYPAATDSEIYWIAGHLHPGVVLKEGRRGAVLRLPCFYFGERGAILPAFGSFTGVTKVDPDPASYCYAIVDQEVALVPTRSKAGKHP